jgi:virginiamycin A acetyltransferase
MKNPIKIFQSLMFHFVKLFIPELKVLRAYHLNNVERGLTKDSTVKLFPPYHLIDVSIDKYSYLSENSIVSNTSIGKFCSIGPNLMSGWGIHPLDGISTSPMFYSTKKQNGFSLAQKDLIVERLGIEIGHDVFIGMNVSILDGVKIGNGAVIGAGAVVSKDIPPYAIAVGNPIKVVKYRFDDDTIIALQDSEWWNFNDEYLKLVSKHFNDIPTFLKICTEKTSKSGKS